MHFCDHFFKLQNRSHIWKFYSNLITRIRAITATRQRKNHNITLRLLVFSVKCSVTSLFRFCCVISFVIIVVSFCSVIVSSVVFPVVCLVVLLIVLSTLMLFIESVITSVISSSVIVDIFSTILLTSFLLFDIETQSFISVEILSAVMVLLLYVTVFVLQLNRVVRTKRIYIYFIRYCLI